MYDYIQLKQNVYIRHLPLLYRLNRYGSMQSGWYKLRSIVHFRKNDAIVI